MDGRVLQTFGHQPGLTAPNVLPLPGPGGLSGQLEAIPLTAIMDTLTAPSWASLKSSNHGSAASWQYIRCSVPSGNLTAADLKLAPATLRSPVITTFPSSCAARPEAEKPVTPALDPDVPKTPKPDWDVPRTPGFESDTPLTPFLDMERPRTPVAEDACPRTPMPVWHSPTTPTFEGTGNGLRPTLPRTPMPVSDDPRTPASDLELPDTPTPEFENPWTPS